MIKMRDKKALVQLTITYMVHRDVQNTEADYEDVKRFLSSCITNTVELDMPDYEPGDYQERFDKDIIYPILNPLWDYYMSNLHDGYNVTLGGNDCE